MYQAVSSGSSVCAVCLNADASYVSLKVCAKLRIGSRLSLSVMLSLGVSHLSIEQLRQTRSYVLGASH